RDDALGRQRLSTYLAAAPIALPRNGDVLTSKAHAVELQQDARERAARHAAGGQHCANRALDRSRLAAADDVDPSLDHRPLARSNTPSQRGLSDSLGPRFGDREQPAHRTVSPFRVPYALRIRRI